MIKRAVDTLEEVDADHRKFFVEASNGGYVLMAGLEDLADKFNEVESAGAAVLAEKDKQLSEATQLLATLKKDSAVRDAMRAAGVRDGFQPAVAALLREKLTDDDVSPETVIWPAPGSEDTELGVLMGPEVRHGEAEVHARVQA